MSRRARTIPRPRRGAIHPTPPAVLAAVLAVVLAGAPALAARKAGDGAVAGTVRPRTRSIASASRSWLKGFSR